MPNYFVVYRVTEQVEILRARHARKQERWSLKWAASTLLYISPLFHPFDHPMTRIFE
ncbi:hypothetical protein AWB67_06426 [Caballeronia terrestris]|uniref:Uncharacterized protein n=1 Tax=Caballeronia terrestris TaxID=1226301 RepID=A0A158KRY9_9BURK|nr:hypothetical protein AWB67_06426 [Caballeronia terrestris]